MKKFIIILTVAILIFLITFTITLYKFFKLNKTVKTSINIQQQDNEQPQTSIAIKDEKIETITVILNKKNRTEEPETIKEIEKPKIPTIKKTTSESTDNAKNYYIKVNYKQNVVTVYTNDETGELTKPYKTMICSTGTATPTAGVYKISNKFKWLDLFGDVYGQYCSQIVGNILFHSVPYTEKGNKASLEYWEYDKLGTACSAGCIRLQVADAKWIYDNCKPGTKVEFYEDDNPGPLGKPELVKISEYEQYRNWDPTDESDENPWNEITEI